MTVNTLQQCYGGKKTRTTPSSHAQVPFFIFLWCCKQDHNLLNKHHAVLKTWNIYNIYWGAESFSHRLLNNSDFFVQSRPLVASSNAYKFTRSVFHDVFYIVDKMLKSPKKLLTQKNHKFHQHKKAWINKTKEQHCATVSFLHDNSSMILNRAPDIHDYPDNGNSPQWMYCYGRIGWWMTSQWAHCRQRSCGNPTTSDLISWSIPIT